MSTGILKKNNSTERAPPHAFEVVLRKPQYAMKQD